MGRAALILAACVAFAGCDQPGASITEPTGGGDDWDDAEEQVYITGIEIASPPYITLYPLSFTPDDLDTTGLVVNALYSNGTATPLDPEQYTIDKKGLGAGTAGMTTNQRVFVRKTVVEVTETEKTRTITAGGETFTETYVEVTTKERLDSKNFIIAVAGTDRVLKSVSLSGSPPAEQTLGAAFSMAGVTVTGQYSDNTTGSLDVRLCRVSGYDYRKRGAQTVSITVNGFTAKAGGASSFSVKTKVPAGATVKPIQFMHSVLPGEEEGYRQVYLKGETFTVKESKLKVEVVSGDATVLLTHANGGLLDGDRVTYKDGGGLVGVLNTTGLQTLSLALDNAKAEFDVYVADVEAQVFFDYGFRRTAADPTGKGPTGPDCVKTLSRKSSGGRDYCRNRHTLR
jgi:hypothetical protein